MARRRGNRVLAGLGEGISNLGLMLYRNQTQDRMDKRAAAAQKAIDDRTEASQRRTSGITLLQKFATEGGDPEQFAQLLSTLMDEPVSVEAVKAHQMSPSRRMEKAIGGSIDTAKSITDIPTEASIMSAGRREGLFDPQFQGPMPEGEESFTGFTPDVRDTAKRAGARRRVFEAEPSKQIDVELPSGASETRFVSPYAGSVQTSPTAEQQGTIAGVKEAATINTVGASRASQAGRARSLSRSQPRSDQS